MCYMGYLTPHLESNTDLQHHTQKRYTYAIDNDVNVHRQLKHKLNCFDLPNPALTCPSPRLTSPLKKYKQKTHYLANIGGREGRQGDEHIGQGWVLRFKATNHNISSSHLESNIDLQHHIQKRYTYAIDNDVNIHRQLEHKLNCFGKQHYQAQALNFQLS
ncbi:hypothetical protein OUZ56_018258 [Daphnia magna]|uniref:Uncharacterized protein n=1 Tax=Daphnia magna TaxID=35525 RepID=A0ABQ9Z924_9CRUS|nr:hypothetical protein OUZ56_018258 [Daphnia magna]